MVFRFSSLVFLIGWEVFYQLISYSVFLLSLPINRFGGFSPATWPFETYQLSYGASMFSVIFRFFPPVFFIGLWGFSPDFYSPSTISHSTEFTSEEESNCNNVTFEAKSSRSGSHVTTIIQNFILVSLISTATSHLFGLPFGATILSNLTHLTTYTWLLTVYVNRRYFRLWELFVFCLLIKEWGLSFLGCHWMAWSWAVG